MAAGRNKRGDNHWKQVGVFFTTLIIEYLIHDFFFFKFTQSIEDHILLPVFPTIEETLRTGTYIFTGKNMKKKKRDKAWVFGTKLYFIEMYKMFL